MALACVAIAWALALGGCSSSRATARSIEISPGAYPEAFDAAREVLRSYKFTLARVDARAGVITTEPRFSYGVASPFDPVQSTGRQRVQDFMNQQDRRVRITFAHPGTAPAAERSHAPGGQADAPSEALGTLGPIPPDPIPPDGAQLDGSTLPDLGEDLRAQDGTLVMHVEVTIDRVSVPHRRLETSSIRQSTFAQEPDLITRGMQPTYTVPRERDDALAARLAEEVRKRLTPTD